MHHSRHAGVWIVLAIYLLISAAAVQAQETIKLPVSNESVNLSDIAKRHEQQDPSLILKKDPENSTGQELSVSALRKRPPYRWMTFQLVNGTNSSIKPLLVVPPSSLIGTGFLWPDWGGKTVLSITASSGAKPEPVFGRPGKYRLTVEPKSTVTYVMEIDGKWPSRIGLWNERIYDFHLQTRAFTRGFLLGIACLIFLYFTGLFFVSRQASYLSSALFAASGIALISCEFGYLPRAVVDAPDMLGRLRAAIEAVMAMGLWAFLLTFLRLRHRFPILGYGVLAVLAALGALVAYAFIHPFYASGVARMAFAAGIVFGSLLIAYLTYRGNARALAILPAWMVLVLWTFFMGAAIVGSISHQLLSPGMAGGLILALILIAVAETQFVSNIGTAGDGASEEVSRKALALAGAGYSVWDFNLEKKTFFVGPEVEKLLGLKRGHFQSGGARVFLEEMHQDDRFRYTAGVEETIGNGAGKIDLEFRLLSADGSYRWFHLLARAVPGENNQASRCVGSLNDITNSKLADERLLRDTVHDYLTGLPNQALFMDRLERAVHRQENASSGVIGLVLIDIDRFRNIHDGLGHAAGDSFLLIAAHRITEQVKEADTVARVSENRFVVLMTSQADEAKIQAVAEKIQKSVSTSIPFKPEDVYLSTNIGMVTYTRGDDDAAELMKKAEIAMYSAKRKSGDLISVFDHRMARRSTNRIALESDLRRAIERNEFKLMYQPIIRLDTGKIAGFEALVRWEHKKRGLLGPAEFMDIAEETGMIIEIGQQVLNEAVMQLGSWQRLYSAKDTLFMSVNVSTRQIHHPDLVKDLKSALDRAEIFTGTLKIEITETQVMENPELASRVLQQIREAGASLSLDDFGTGHSSLSYLQSFPFDTIKIDKVFVQSQANDKTNGIILKSVIALAHDLGMQVVAEGVEKLEEAAKLKAMGCEFVQGFLFGESMTVKAAQKLLGHKPMGAEQSVVSATFDKLGAFTTNAALTEVTKEKNEEKNEPVVVQMNDIAEIAVPPKIKEKTADPVEVVTTAKEKIVAEFKSLEENVKSSAASGNVSTAPEKRPDDEPRDTPKAPKLATKEPEAKPVQADKGATELKTDEPAPKPQTVEKQVTKSNSDTAEKPQASKSPETTETKSIAKKTETAPPKE